MPLASKPILTYLSCSTSLPSFISSRSVARESAAGPPEIGRRRRGDPVPNQRARKITEVAAQSRAGMVGKLSRLMLPRPSGDRSRARHRAANSRAPPGPSLGPHRHDRAHGQGTDLIALDTSRGRTYGRSCLITSPESWSHFSTEIAGSKSETISSCASTELFFKTTFFADLGCPQKA